MVRHSLGKLDVNKINFKHPHLRFGISKQAFYKFSNSKDLCKKNKDLCILSSKRQHIHITDDTYNS